MGTAINRDTAKSKKYSLTGGTTSEKNNFFIYGGADDLFSRACGTEESQNAGLPEDTENGSAKTEISDGGVSQTEQGHNVLVVYFSWADNAVLTDDVDVVASPSVISPGNVQQLAGRLWWKM